MANYICGEVGERMDYYGATAKRISLLYSRLNTLEDALSSLSRLDIDVTQHAAALALIKTRLKLVDAYLELEEIEAKLTAEDEINTLIKLRDKVSYVLEAYATAAEHNDVLLTAIQRKARHVQRAIDGKINALLSSTVHELEEIAAQIRRMEEDIMRREQL